MEEQRVATNAAASKRKSALKPNTASRTATHRTRPETQQLSAPRRSARKAVLNGKTAPAQPASRKARRSAKKSGRYSFGDGWWAAPVSAALIVVIVALCSYIAIEGGHYIGFLDMRNAVEKQTFYNGVSIDGVDMSSITLQEALTEWAARDERVRDSLHVKLVLGDRSWPIDDKSLGYDSDYENIIMGAWSVGRYGTLNERYQAVQKLGTDEWKRPFQVERGLDQAVAIAKLIEFCQTLSVDAVDAKVAGFDMNDNTFMYTKSIAGKKVYADELLNDIKAAAAAGKESVQIVQHIIEPKHTIATLAQEYGQVSKSTTDGSFSNSNRLNNLKVACNVLNGLRIEPGEVFSYNETLGKRTAAAGYKLAGAYENGITTNQLGGGICQVSTTLFNALVKADMKILERSPHSRPSHYIGLGKDAAVNWPNQDLKFKNTSDYPIYITAKVTAKKKVEIAILGLKFEDGGRIEITSKTLNTYAALEDKVTKSNNLEPGERVVIEAARKGYMVVTYKHYLDKDGKELKKVQLCKSYYAPSGAIIHVG